MYTSEQLEAINTINTNITVSASAGAGKTAVLVERLMKRILIDNISVDKIVALTFTDAAAAEMKNRLMEKLLEKQAEDPTNTYINEQITLLPNANISTIHSFCLNILKDYYYILDINPIRLNNILSDNEQYEISEDSFNYLLNNYDNELIADTLKILNNNLNNLFSLIKNLSTEANSTINPDKFLDDSIIIYDDFKKIVDIPEPYLSMFFKFHSDQVLKLKKESYILARIIDDNEKVDKQREWINQVINNISSLENSLYNQDYDTYKNTIELIASLKNSTISKNDEYKKARDTYYETLNKIVSILYPQKDLLNNLRKNKEVALNIINMTKVYNNHYLQTIIDSNKITFNDMETLTYKLISKNNDEVANILKSQISDILIDEFQDTNMLQNAIIEKLGNGFNIFRVGDVKQSIYRFRGAKPQIMQELINQKDSDKHKTIYLSNNFRSKESIVDYVNHFFNNLMNLDTFDSEFRDSDIVSVGTQKQKEDIKDIKLHLINNDKEHYEELDDDFNLSTDEFKANFIAHKILQLYNEDANKRWSKYTVLVESHNRKLALKSAFDKANIPYFIAFPDGLLDSLGVSVIIAYLKLIYNPDDLISLVSILTNLYGYSENEISKLFIKYKDLKLVSKHLNEHIYQDIYHFNKNQNKNTINKIVSHVLNINDFYEEKLSKQSRTNIDLFIDYINEYDESKSGVLGFLELIDQFKNSKASEGSSISSEDNVVNVMTIHNSKGLQFDTVFLFSKSSIRNKRDPNYLVSPVYGLALKTFEEEYNIVYDNIANLVIEYFDEQELLEEEMRKLYVALTRAQNDLYIIDTIKLKEDMDTFDFDENIVRSKKGFTTWILALEQYLPHTYLNFDISETLEYSEASKAKELIIKINKFNPIKQVSSETNQFIPSKLDLKANTSGVDIGTLVHKTIENLDNLEYTYDNIKKISPTLSDYYINKLITLSKNELFTYINQFDVYHEFVFIINQIDMYQQGFIDFLSISEKDIYIVDFKTDNLSIETEFIERYKQQLLGYINAISKLYPNKNIHTYIYSFNLDTFIEFKVN